MQYATHLTPDASGFFDRWDTTTPGGARNQQGVTWCTDFVATAVSAVTGKAFTGYPDAAAWLSSFAHPGLLAVATASGVWPLPGDVVVLDTAWKGHVAIIVGVLPPAAGADGSVVVAQAHATHVLESWSLHADGTLTPPWNEWTATLGYLRLPQMRQGIASRVQPLLQWDQEAGYDSRAQHDQYWDSACSAAVFTEIARAFGLQVRLGQVIDQLVAAGYLSASAGLSNDAAAWPWIARQYGMQAVVQWNRALSYDALVQFAAGQGIPVVVNVRDTSGRYFPAFAGGHFLVVIGGDASGLKIVDSSLYRITSLPRSEFEALWTGRTVVLSPVTASTG
jgi:surface antigen